MTQSYRWRRYVDNDNLEDLGKMATAALVALFIAMLLLGVFIL